MVDSPYPELKKTHTMVRMGRPWTDPKPPPAAPVWEVIQGFVNYWVLVAAIELQLFDALHRENPVSVAALAATLRVDERRVGDVVDALTVLGFVEVVNDGLLLSDVAERYLTVDGAASMTTLIAVANGPHENWPTLSLTVRHGAPANPIEDDPVAFYRPLVEATFVTQHRAATRLGLRLGWARRPGLTILDLGAGGAPWALAACLLSPGSRAVVNDLAGVIELAAEKAAGFNLADRIELRPGDYHFIDIEADRYDVVILAHTCRAEGPDGTRRLLRRAGTALKPHGQLILADYVRGASRTTNPFAALMGATLTASTTHGTTFTGPELVTMLTDAGFGAIRLHEPLGGQFAYSAEKV